MNDDKLLAGRTALVTGAFGGLGLHFAQVLAAHGARVALAGRRIELGRTVVLCGGEFGRTPNLNPFGGRDHWPNGYSLAIAGGGLKGGLAIGKTDPDG